MARKGKRKKQKKRPAPHSAGPGVCNAEAPADAEDPLANARSEIAQLTADGKTKSAVTRAKELHKRLGTPESEALLLDAYFARIQSMIDKDMLVEATVLADLVGERFSAARDRLDVLLTPVAARSGMLDGLVGPLKDAGISKERRLVIEDTIRREVTDLGALASCAALPTEHPLRNGAAAISAAFDAVTSGPVDDAILALDEVPRRGPLAPWKMLVRAIASFYRNDDETCRKCLGAIVPESAPARLVPVIEGLLARHVPSKLGRKAQALATEIGGGMEELPAALRELDRVLGSDQPGSVMKAIRRAVSVCKRTNPGLLEELKRRISIQTVGSGTPLYLVNQAMGERALMKARLWLMIARQEERLDGPGCIDACGLLEEFRKHAIHEGLFARDSVDEGVLYAHMARSLAGLDKEDLEIERDAFLESFSGYSMFYEGQPASIRALAPKMVDGKWDCYFAYPDELYERACARNPDAQTFSEWMMWAEGHQGKKASEKVAGQWHEAVPGDSRPLLLLVAMAEKRQAYRKALGYLELAEQCDGLNPVVQQARLRISMDTLLRHFAQGKAHLAERDIAAIEGLPRVQRGKGVALMAALRWACCTLRGNEDEAVKHRAQAAEAFKDELTTDVFLWGVSAACRIDEKKRPVLPRPSAKLPKGVRAKIVAHACALGNQFGLAIPIPSTWDKKIEVDLKAAADALEDAELDALAGAGLREGKERLVYAVTVAGLKRGKESLPQFLLLRARVLPREMVWRAEQCIAATAELARDLRRFDLLDLAVDLWRSTRGYHWGLIGNPADVLSVEPGHLKKTIEREMAARAYPSPQTRRASLYERRFYRDCDCAQCRIARGEEADDLDDWDESNGGWEEEDDSGFDDAPESTIEIFKSYIERIRQAASSRKPRKKAKKKGAAGKPPPGLPPPPVQEDLF